MKWIALALALLISPALADDSKDTREVAGVAESFFKSYLKVVEQGAGYEDTLKWIKKSPVPTDGYKAALAKLYDDAAKADPELGYGADAVICGQDWPDKGFKAGRIWIAGPLAFVQMASRDSGVSHNIDAKFVKIDGAWRLDGTGPLSGGTWLAVRKSLTDQQLSDRLAGSWKGSGQEFIITGDGGWKDEDGLDTWKVRNGNIVRGGAAFEGDRFPIYLVDETTLIYGDPEGITYRLERQP